MPFQRRLLWMYLAFCLGLGLVWLRAAQLQVVDGDYWEQKAEELRRWGQPLEGLRGSIVDADGQVLAEDVAVPQLILTPDDWLRRERLRCLHCGLVHVYAAPEVARELAVRASRPRRCSCQVGLSREEAARLARFEELLPGDVAPIEAALGLPGGSLASKARERIAEINALMDAQLESLLQQGLDEPFARNKVSQQRADYMHRPVVVATDVPEEVLRAVETDEAARFQGLSVRPVLRRRYPLGDFAPQLLGFASLVAGSEELEALRKQYGSAVTATSRVGRRGLERALNGQLHGAPGQRILERGEGGLFTELVREQPPSPGRRVRLSISARASRAAEEVLERRATRAGFFPGGRPSAAFVALDALTGEILVWAETPRFDLNTELDDIFRESPRDGVADPVLREWNPRPALAGDEGLDIEAFRRDLTVPEPRSLSRIAQVAVEPGSTFKVLIALAMLESGLGLPHGGSSGDAFHCTDDRRRPHCHPCGSIGLEEAIARSCNRWFAFGLRDSEQWNGWRRSVPAFLQRLGIGQPPGLEVREWSDGLLLRNWWDCPPAAVVDAARARLPALLGPRTPEVLFRADPQLPASVAGDPEQVGGLLARVIAQVVGNVDTRRIVVSVGTESQTEDEILLRFDLRLGELPHWASLPGLVSADLPTALAGMAGRGRAGANGRLLEGGSVWFTARFERRIGRASPDEPIVIRPQDGRNVAIGQGPLLVTPLQMARAMAVFANGGRRIEPHAVVQVGDLALRPEVQSLGISPANLEWVRKGMWLAVNGDLGTARRAPWHLVPATVYGKTGTAQVGSNWRPYPQQEGEEPWHHWFAGYAELRGGRRVAFACLLHARREGAAAYTAVEATCEILQQWLGSTAQGDGG